MSDINTIFGILAADDAKLDLPLDLVERTAKELSHNIYTEFSYLNVIEKQHGAAISVRWKKKSPAKRRELLCAVWSEMPATHRPEMEDPHFYCAKCTCGGAKKVFYRNELWPYINLEDLSDARSLLELIKVRAHNRPSTFASTELSYSPAAAPRTTREQLKDPSISFADQDFEAQQYIPELYGRVVDPAEPECIVLNGLRTMYLLGPGLQMLRIQAGLLRFLVDCCIKIMHDIPSDMILADARTIPFQPPSLPPQDFVSSSLKDAAIKAEYCARSMPDCTRIRHLISTVLNSIKDHAWALREDPVYFAEHVQDHVEHRHENILNKAGQPSERLGTRYFNSCVLREIMASAYGTLIVWDQLYQESLKLEALYELTLQGEVTEELFRRYLDAMKVVYFLLLGCKGEAAGFLQNFARGSPHLRHLYVRKPIQGTSDYTAALTATDDVVGSRVEKLLGRVSDEDSTVDVSHCHLDCLETYCGREPSARSKLSPFIEHSLTQLSISVECLHLLRVSSCADRMTPHFDFLEIDAVVPKPVLGFLHAHEKWRETMENGGGELAIPNLEVSSNGKLDYPSETVHTKQAVEARRKAERNLDRFWRCVDRSFRKLTGYSQHATIRRLFDEGGPMQRTAPWYDPEGHDASPKSIIAYEYQPISEIFHDPTKEITGNFDRLAVAGKIKSKTHSEIDAAAHNADEAAQERPMAMSKPLYHVGKDAYVVIKALFHVPNDSEPPGKIRWDQLVATLTKLGFAVEKLHGSAWQFTPKKLNLPRGIQFHEPHPSGEVPLTLARRYGRRLARAYGWEAAMFKQK
ncbi:uncharacterized protein J4E84_009411 [Alternaria hordeiaustralica]|uniref:uncharacterized protein n=1 Tax=Alternaria hordeiaustralica TaxID=1187925 RepID=UPI0020C3096D|nr:uncharacterized protein J4E84_009411 [Alternaria hordeiaustralica]KAI4676816.1 hypothetical protein J4E84_009411 [Alternaria hordeiaustralica]